MKAARHLRYLAYGLLGMPLAMSALPIYVQVPVYYTGTLGLALASTGWVLFLARLVDTVQDPWLGRCIDRLQGVGLSLWMLAGALILALAFWGVWLPPQAIRSNHGALLAWLAAMLVVAYTAHSMLNIAYMAWGARLSQHSDGLLGAAAMREMAGLLGAVIAGAIPSMIFTGGKAVDPQLQKYGAGFAILLALALLALLYLAPRWNKLATGVTGWRESLRIMAANAGFRRLVLPAFLNAVSMAIPVTLAVFFINDRLQMPQHAGTFLGVYFLSSACGLPIWVTVAKRLGVLQTWRVGMVLAIVTFAGAGLLGPGDFWPYMAVCVLAGLALGADLSLPPVLLATMIEGDENTAAYYGIWALLGKLSLAISGLALPLLALLGYQPGSAADISVAAVYAFVPCLVKLIALVLLQPLLKSLQSGAAAPLNAALAVDTRESMS